MSTISKLYPELTMPEEPVYSYYHVYKEYAVELWDDEGFYISGSFNPEPGLRQGAEYLFTTKTKQEALDHIGTLP